MSPYSVLGLSDSATNGEAQRAFRKLAMLHHPDRGGSEEKFKAVKEAWELIQKGWTPPPTVEQKQKQWEYKSSFGGGAPKPQPSTGEPAKKYAKAGKPAPGYEERGALKTPRTQRYRTGGGYSSGPEYGVIIEISEKHGFEGCTVPFQHGGRILEYIVRPGTVTDRTEVMTFPLNEMIGANAGFVSIKIDLVITKAPVKREEEKRDAEVVVPLAAIGLYIGGTVTVLDHLGERIPVTVPSGYDPTEPIKIPGKGFGTDGNRGALIVRIRPLFKAPADLNSTELRLLQRMNEMAKHEQA